MNIGEQEESFGLETKKNYVMKWIMGLLGVIVASVLIGSMVFWKDVSAGMKLLNKEDEYLLEQLQDVRKESEKADEAFKIEVSKIEARLEIIRIEQNENNKIMNAKLDNIINLINKLD